MKVRLVLEVDHPAYGVGEFESERELYDTTSPVNMMSICMISFIHVITKACHVMSNCYKNKVKFGTATYDCAPPNKNEEATEAVEKA